MHRPARNATNDALRRVIDYYLYRDLQRGWRVVAPNLKTAGCPFSEHDGLLGATDCQESEVWERGFSYRVDRDTEEACGNAGAAARLSARTAGRTIRRRCARRALAVKVDASTRATA